MGRDVIEVFGQAVETEIRWNAVEAPGFALRLEKADQQLAGIFLVVGPFVADEQDRKVAWQIGDRLRDHIEMLDCLQGHGDADLGRQLARPHATADHHVLRPDRALRGHHAGRAAPLHQDLRHGQGFDDARAAHPRALGVGHRHVGGVHLSVHGGPEAAHEIGCVDQRPALLDAGRGDRLDRKAEIAGHGGAAGELLVACGIVGDTKGAVAAKAGSLARLRFERAEQLTRILRQFGHLPRRTQLRHQARGVPGRAAGELLALAQDHVADAELREVIGDGAAGNATSNDDDFGARGNVQDRLLSGTDRPTGTRTARDG